MTTHIYTKKLSCGGYRVVWKVKCLAYKHEGQSSNPQLPHEAPVWGYKVTL